MVVQEISDTSLHNTRQAVIEALRRSGQATVSELAGMVGVKAVTIRHHLNSLQADGLVEMQEQRRSVGRPVHVYRLTQRAERLFPHTYDVLVDRLLAQIKQKLSPGLYEALIDGLAESLAREIRSQVAHLPPDARRERLIEVLDKMGAAAQWRFSDDGLQLVKHHCPYHAVSERHPELCRIDEAMVEAALDAGVRRVGCLLAGDPCCTLALSDTTP